MADFKVIESQEELDNIIKQRLERERAKIESDFKAQIKSLEYEKNSILKEKEAALADIADLKVNASKIESLESKLGEYEKRELRRQVAFEKGIPFNLADRIKGDDEEAMKADADSLSEYFKSQKSVAPMKNLEPEVKDEITSAYSKLIKDI